MTSLQQTIAELVEARSDKIVATLSDLVRFPSVVRSNPKDAGPGERDFQLCLQNMKAA